MPLGWSQIKSDTKIAIQFGSFGVFWGIQSKKWVLTFSKMASRVKGPDIESGGANENVSNRGAYLRSNCLELAKVAKEKHKMTTMRQDWKPPRPPNSPSFDAADLKLVRQILTEMSRRKKAKIPRIKTMRKLKAVSKVSPLSSSSPSKGSAISMSAMVLMIVFFLALINFSVQ